jgi:hypothetical protein
MKPGGLLLDSGALFAFERARRTIGVILDEAIDDDLVVHVPSVRGSSTIDAIVAASASRLGLPIVTSDPDDMSPLADHFGGLALIAI